MALSGKQKRLVKEAIEVERTSGTSKIMQYPSELTDFLCFMLEHNVKSFLEIGVKAGHLTLFLKKFMDFDNIYSCDINCPDDYAGHDMNFFHGSSHSDEYKKWRKGIGHIDMVLIDADHKYKPAKADYMRELTFPNKFIALHDISNPGYPHLSKMWKKEVKGNKKQFINEDENSVLICLEERDQEGKDRYKKKYGISCGIGIRWD